MYDDNIRHFYRISRTIEKRPYDYAPFGKAISGVGADQRLSYIDKEKDKESGLGDFGVRKYEDGYGRFLSIDPLWEEYRSLTPYNYCGNNPLLLRDPTGFGWGDDIVSVVAKGYNKLEAGLDRMSGKLMSSLGRMSDKLLGSFERMSDKVTASVDRMSNKLQGTDKVSTAVEKVSDGKQQVAESSESGKDEGNTNPFLGPVVAPVIIVDIVGNMIPVATGEQVQGSPDGTFMQVKNAEGKPTGIRKDGPHGPRHSPEGKVPHAHRPDVPGTEHWLPVKTLPGQSTPVP